jgi:hypothetical protein
MGFHAHVLNVAFKKTGNYDRRLPYAEGCSETIPYLRKIQHIFIMSLQHVPVTLSAHVHQLRECRCLSVWSLTRREAPSSANGTGPSESSLAQAEHLSIVASNTSKRPLMYEKGGCNLCPGRNDLTGRAWYASPSRSRHGRASVADLRPHTASQTPKKEELLSKNLVQKGKGFRFKRHC